MKQLKKHGHYQRECHHLLLETFDTKPQAYKWLKQTFNIQHFSQIKTGDPIIEKIWAALVCHPNNTLIDL